MSVDVIVLMVSHSCLSGSGVADAFKLATCLGDVSYRIEACGGTTNVAPDRASWLLIWQKTGKKTASPCESGA